MEGKGGGGREGGREGKVHVGKREDEVSLCTHESHVHVHVCKHCCNCATL